MVMEYNLISGMEALAKEAGLTLDEVQSSDYAAKAERAAQGGGSSLVYEEGDIIKRAIRDMYDHNTNNVIVDGNEGYQKAKNFMKILMPENVKKN